MSRSARKHGGGVDPERIVLAAVNAFLGDGSGARQAEADDHRDARRRVGGGALALGVVVGIGARVLYRRARDFDLASAARAVEQRIVN